MLRIVGLVTMTSLLMLLASGERPPISVENRLPSPGEGLFEWTPRSSGDCLLFLKYKAESLPMEVKTNFIGGGYPQTTWEAQLVVMSEGKRLLSKKVLELKPGMSDGQDYYFWIDHFETKADGRVTISLAAQQPLPFDGAVPLLAAISNLNISKMHQFTHPLWLAARFLCALVSIAVLADYLKLAAVSRRQPVTPDK